MSLLDVEVLTRLQSEFRQSMKTLLIDLCGDIDDSYADLANRLKLPVGYFRTLAHSLERSSFSNWKVVGWIETLNDLVYFLDLLQQVRKERELRDFAEQLFFDCEQRYFENSYLEDLFPLNRPQTKGLGARLQRLCTRLALP